MTLLATKSDQDVILTESQREVVEMDLGLVGTWWKIMTKPRSFFIRAGVHAGHYGDDLLFKSGQGPDPMSFFIALLGVSVILSMILSGSFLAGAEVLMSALFGIVRTGIGYFLLSGICHLLVKAFRCPGNYDAAKSLVSFVYAPVVLVSLGSLLMGIPALLGLMYGVVLVFFGIRYIYRTSIWVAFVIQFLLFAVLIGLGILSWLVQGGM